MKKLVKCFLLAATVALLFAGCNGLNTNDATVDADGYSSQMCRLSISVDGAELASVDNSLTTKSVARTINPVSLEIDATPITAFTLKGVNVTTGATLGTDGAGIALTSSNAVSGQTNTFKVSIPYGQWDFTLEATASDGKLLLKGESYKDLRTTASTVNFTLTTDNVETAGHVNLAGTFEDNDSIAATYSAGLYNTETGNLISNTELTDQNVGTGHSFTYNLSTVDIAPGRYSFQIKFFNSSSNQVGYWEDIVVIAPGRTTTDTAISCGKIIFQKPASPANLRAFLKTNSEDADGYTVILTWDDMSTNEENFVIYVEEYASDAANATKTTYKILGVEAADPTDADDKREVFHTSAMNAGGSVRASSHTASIKLPFGKVFDVSIRAQNFVGLSKFSDTVDACPRVTTTATAPANSTLIDSDKLNRMVIKYFLDNGTLTLIDGSVKTGNYILYKSIYEYADADEKLLSNALITINNNPAAGTTSNHLVRDSQPFVKWVKADGSSIAATDAITYEGIEVKASYDPLTSISYSIEDGYEEITAIVKYDGTAVPVSTDNSVDVSDNKDLTFEVTPPTGKTISSISVKLSNGNKQWISGTEHSSSWTFDKVSEIPAGPLTASITATIEVNGKKKNYGFTIVLDLQR